MNFTAVTEMKSPFLCTSALQHVAMKFALVFFITIRTSVAEHFIPFFTIMYRQEILLLKALPFISTNCNCISCILYCILPES